jgi:hypothetical protein
MIGYIVTSAINTRFGVFDTDTRLQQTIDTITSIKARDRNAHITLVEMAAVPLTDAQKAELNKHIDILIDFTNDDVVRRISLSDNWDIVKNATEMLCFRHALKLIQGSPDSYVGVDRFVKVSGRYKLNENYKPAMFKKVKDKIVFAKRKQSQFDPKVTGGQSEQFMSRCWSFPAAKIADIETQFYNMIKRMETALQFGGYLDIEHLLCMFTDPTLVHEVNTIGVEGLIGPNGVQVKD